MHAREKVKVTKEMLKQERDKYYEQFYKRVEAERKAMMMEGKYEDFTSQLRFYLNKLAAAGNNEAISLFFDSFQDLSFIDRKSRNADTALMQAAEAGHLSTCELLISKLGKERINDGAGFDCDHTSDVDINALNKAIAGEHLEVCQLLVQHGIQVTHSRGFISTLALAVIQNDSRILQYLLQPADRTTIGITQKDLDQVLSEANNREFVSILVDAGARIEERDGCGYNAIENAIDRADEESIRYLLEKGANLDTVNFNDLLNVQAYKGLILLLRMVDTEQKSRIIALCESRYQEIEQAVADEELEIEDPQSKACFASFFTKKSTIKIKQIADSPNEFGYI